MAWGALLEGKAWGTSLAFARIVATVGVVAWFTRGTGVALPALGTALGVSLVAVAWILWCRAPARAEVATAQPT